EADLHDDAYGYRPGRSAAQAVQEVHRELAEGKTEVIDADLSKYFDTIPHAELMKSVARRISDTAVLHLIKMWLKTPVEERDEKGRPRMSETLRRGRNEPWPIIRDELNWVLRGWASYFAYGSPSQAFRLVAIHVTERARNLLRRRHRLPRGTARL